MPSGVEFSALIYLFILVCNSVAWKAPRLEMLFVVCVWLLTEELFDASLDACFAVV